jgi:hypothetical protein
MTPVYTFAARLSSPLRPFPIEVVHPTLAVVALPEPILEVEALLVDSILPMLLVSGLFAGLIHQCLSCPCCL